jgi:hypothetical protein
MAIKDSAESVAPPQGIGQCSAALGSRADLIDQMIERWWQDHFPGSPVARDTQAWNAAYAAKETLKRLLKRSI